MKRSIATVMTAATLAALIGLASCGNSGKATTGKTGRPRVTFMLTDYEGSPLTGEHAQEVIDKMTEWTNTDVEFTFVANDSYEEKMGLALASPDDMPMVMHVGKVNLGIVDAANAGAFWDLNEFIWDSEKYPNLSKANKDVCKSLTIGGKLIGVYKARDIGRYGLGYRTDWAEKLGLSEPKTIEDVYNMMHAFTYNDPDGDGLNNTYGLAMCKYTGPFDIIQAWFGAGNGWTEQNGKLIPVHQTKEYKEALDWMKKMYEDGLIAPDWAVRDTATWQDQVKKGEAGMFIDVMDGSRRIWDYFVNNNVPSVLDPSQPAGMTLVGPINGKTLATSGYNGFLVVTKAAKTKAQVEACLHYIDKMCDSEMLTLAAYGLKDINYTIDADGFLVDTDTKDPSASKCHSALNQTQCFIPTMLANNKPSVKQTPRKMKELEVIKNNEQYAVFNPALSFLANSETYATQGAILDQLLSDARTQYICGQIDAKGLQSAFDKWNKQGGESVINEVNEQYKANQLKK
ncbi:MAG: extracellular solute-binding protein [Treponema sp.]|nr:extracellular solute-binding protein [Treponema sp.]